MERSLELVGLSGAGKSTLAALARERLSAAGATAWADTEWRRHWLGVAAPWRRTGRWLRLKLAACLGGLGALRAGWAAAAACGLPWRQRLHALRLLLVRLEARRCARHLPAGDLLIVDEGPLQLALRFHLAAGAGDFPDPRPYARAIPAAGWIVHLRAAPVVAAERARGRERGLPRRFSALSAEGLETTLETAGRLIDEMLTEVADHHPAARIEAIPADDPEESRRRFAASLEQWLQPEGAADG